MLSYFVTNRQVDNKRYVSLIIRFFLYENIVHGNIIMKGQAAWQCLFQHPNFLFILFSYRLIPFLSRSFPVIELAQHSTAGRKLPSHALQHRSIAQVRDGQIDAHIV